ncbi:macrophage colony-stimulating factor 1 receptor [Lepisosteus oculatus]|uniref:macrophage colony-stimulating factor 1 receptor n=1 Tax=Lepisosteus oculatus TaxID=7918 RepID=UPI0035F51B93
MLHLFLILGVLPCAAQDLKPPEIKPNVPEMVMNSGEILNLRCNGDNTVTWIVRLAKYKKYIKNNGTSSIFRARVQSSEFTGTYKCAYQNQPDLFSSVHVYVKDSSQLFITGSYNYHFLKKEGESVLLPCLLTDPSATDFSLRMENGSSVPRGMNYTADPKRGITIENLQPSFNADYVCRATKNGIEKVSSAFSINVIQKLRLPPYVFLETDEYIRIVGEKLEISCTTHNPNFNYNVTWKHSTRKALNVSEAAHSEGSRLAIRSILTIPKVSMSDTGNITCIGINEAGVNSSTTYLQVVDKPYIRLSTPQNTSLEVQEGQDLELKVLIEAYPAIVAKEWDTPRTHNTSAHEEHFEEFNNRYKANLLLKRMKTEEHGQYIFYARSTKANASIKFHVRLHQKPKASVKWHNTSRLTCTASGYPAPNIQWYQCSGIISTCKGNKTGTSELLSSDENSGIYLEHDGIYIVESSMGVFPFTKRMTVECVASNSAGEGHASFTTEVLRTPLFTTTLAGSVAVACLFLVLLIILLYKYKQKPRYEIRWKIIESSDGNNYTFIDPTQLPYNEKWEFPRDKLRLGKILGAGAFGKVVEATAYGLGKEDNVVRVAVKMLKPSAHSDEREALMSELKILSHLGHHKNIVNLLGACTHGGPVLVITEYCSYGDLLNFLRNKAETFLAYMSGPSRMEEVNDYKNLCIEKKYIRSDSGISSACSDGYLEMKPGFMPSHAALNTNCDETKEDTWPVDMDDLLRFSYQVAQGLSFLAEKNCIHRDVAARNVLLTDGRIAKICDFGLARDIMNDSSYVVKGNARLPVKWMAPESIFDCVYTVQSDVWSYGILLWEIFSLGKSPYPNILVDTKFYKMIKDGYQMSRPDYALPEMYTIMKMCWNLEPTKRPTFDKIGKLIQRLLGDQTHQIYENVERNAVDEQPEPCDAPKCSEDSCDQGEEDQPLMKTNNYQFC